MREMAEAGGLTAEDQAEARRLLAMALETAPVPAGLAATLAPGQRGAAPLPGDLLGLIRKDAARQWRRRALAPAGAVALAAAVAGGLATGGVVDRGGAGSPTAREVLTAAVVKTSAQSFAYSYTVVGSVQAPRNAQPGLAGPVIQPWSGTGKFDPVSGTGEEEDTEQENLAPPYGKWVHWPVLFVGDYSYTKVSPAENHGKPWLAMRGPSLPGSAYSQLLGLAYHDSTFDNNPATILAALKSVSPVREVGPASGPGWTGTKYSFTLHNDHSATPGSMSGTVSVDSSGRVRQLVTVLRTQIPFPRTKASQGPSGYYTSTVTGTTTFGSFGIPVSVTAPQASQVYFQKS